MIRLFTPLKLRDIQFKNRIFVSPMCQYSAQEGLPDDWHLVHLGSRAVGGASLVIVEATAVSPAGRISPGDLGIWSDRQAEALGKIAAFIKAQGAIPGIQLGHAGRKASTDVPWKSREPLLAGKGGWQVIGPSALPFEPRGPLPREMEAGEIEEVILHFREAARRSIQAGFEVVELHMAHGYLFHQFYSPLINQRTDGYGGSFENRIRFPLEAVQSVRQVWPQSLPLFVRISCTDWMEGGWDLGQSIDLSRRFKEYGVDLVDCSTGGAVPEAAIPAGPGYQTLFAASIRRHVGIPTGAVGLITDPAQAEQIVATGQADAVLLGREFLQNPYWPFRAAKELGVEFPWPVQYQRAKK
jgi:2,4-dienoyl-CoA reductase-like NADH-dependent reductase (Old Yellow Enzyme family)